MLFLVHRFIGTGDVSGDVVLDEPRDGAGCSAKRQRSGRDALSVLEVSMGVALSLSDSAFPFVRWDYL